MSRPTDYVSRNFKLSRLNNKKTHTDRRHRRSTRRRHRHRRKHDRPIVDKQADQKLSKSILSLVDDDVECSDEDDSSLEIEEIKPVPKSPRLTEWVVRVEPNGVQHIKRLVCNSGEHVHVDHGDGSGILVIDTVFVCSNARFDADFMNARPGFRIGQILRV